jgi:hypothetical protein
MARRSSITPTFRDQNPLSAINEVAAHLAIFPDQTTAYQSGSCCRIAKNLYLTAAHVIHDWVKKFGAGNAEQDFDVWAVHARGGPEYSIWRVDRIWTCSFSDLAIMHTQPYNEVAAKESHCAAPLMRLEPPNVGERIIGFGRHSPSQSITIDKHGTRHIVLNASGSASVGEVKEIHPEKRDRIQMPFPCYEVNARFDGGMSGGPVFDDQGHLCGVICSTFPPIEESEEDASYVATLWPLMATQIDVLRDGSISKERYPLIELARQGVLHVPGHNRVEIRQSAISGETLVQLLPQGLSSQ